MSNRVSCLVASAAAFVALAAAAQDAIVIGQSAPLTGPAADIGRDIRDSKSSHHGSHWTDLSILSRTGSYRH